ncbi:MAG: hypothetical protein ACYDH4_09965 [Candidatus Cryosericum sp.]
MSALSSDIRGTEFALEKVRRAAREKTSVTLTADEARRVVEHLEWLSKERDTLFDSLPED